MVPSCGNMSSAVSRALPCTALSEARWDEDDYGEDYGGGGCGGDLGCGVGGVYDGGDAGAGGGEADEHCGEVVDVQMKI